MCLRPEFVTHAVRPLYIQAAPLQAAAKVFLFPMQHDVNDISMAILHIFVLTC